MMDSELLDRALKGTTPLMLLHELSGNARTDVVEALAAAMVQRDALELAGVLEGEPMTTAKQAAVAPLAAVKAARKALAKEQSGIAAKLAAYFKRLASTAATPDESEPDRESPKLLALREALAAAEAEAFPHQQAVKILEEQVAGLRAAPAPDEAVLTVLRETLAAEGG